MHTARSGSQAQADSPNEPDVVPARLGSERTITQAERLDVLSPYELALEQYRNHRFGREAIPQNVEHDRRMQQTYVMTESQYNSARMQGMYNFTSFSEMIRHRVSILTQEGWWNINNTARELQERYANLQAVLRGPEGFSLIYGARISLG